MTQHTDDVDRTSHSYLLGRAEAQLAQAKTLLLAARVFIRSDDHAAQLLDDIERFLNRLDAEKPR